MRPCMRNSRPPLRHLSCSHPVQIEVWGLFPRTVSAGTKILDAQGGPKELLITPDMTVREALAVSPNVLAAFAWLAPEFERLREPSMRRAMGDRVNVRQAARIAHTPLAEALYVLNLAAGEDEKYLAQELLRLGWDSFEYKEENPPRKPRELVGLRDTDPVVHFVDVTPQARR